MKKYEMTDWFPIDVKPVHIGVYEVKGFSTGKYCLWNGKSWAWCQSTVRYAYKYASTKNASQLKNWRGIKKDMT
jgi:hypothetical protein